MGRATALKAVHGPHRLTPTGTRQDFLLRISSLQAERKVLATDPAWTAWALLGASWPGTLLLESPPEPTTSHKPGVCQACEVNSHANNSAALGSASPA